MKSVDSWMRNFRKSINIPMTYLIFGFLWIFFSDKILSKLVPNVAVYAYIQTIKGFLFIIITSILVWILIYREMSKYSMLMDKVSKTNSRYKNYFEEGIIGIILLDDALKIINVNKRASEVIEKNIDELLHLSLMDLFLNLRIDKNYFEILRDNHFHIDAMQLEFIRDDGLITYVIFNISPVFAENGLVDQYVVYIQKINKMKELEDKLRESNEKLVTKVNETESMNKALQLENDERIRSENSFNESEQRLKNIVNFLPDATFAIDIEGHVILWNQAMARLTHISSEEMIGQSNYHYALPFYGVRRPMLINLVLKDNEILARTYIDLEREKDSLSAVAETTHVDGRTRIYNTKAAPLYNAQGSIVGAIQTLTDVTTTKSSELLLRESERQFRTLIEQASVPIQIYASDGVLIDANKAAEELWQVSSKNLIDSYNVYNDKCLINNGSIEIIKHAFEGSVIEPFELQYDVELPSGESVEKWLKTRIYPIFDDDNQINRVVMMHEDISELKKYENHMMQMVNDRTKALETISKIGKELLSVRNIENAYDSLKDSILNFTGAEDFYIVLADMEHRELNYVYDSRREDRSAGYRRPFGNSLVDSVIQTKEPLNSHGNRSRIEKRSLGGDPADDVMSWIGVPMIEEDRVLGVMCIQHHSDPHAFSKEQLGVVESIANETAISIINSMLYKEVKREKTYFESLVNVSPIAIVTTDKENHIIIWNPAAEELFGYSYEEVIGQKIDDVVSCKNTRSRAEELSAQVLGGESVHFITRRCRRSGLEFDVEIYGVPVDIDYVNIGQVAIYHDISELLNARKEAELANKHKGEFLANMSHEIRTPMNAIIGFSELALMTDLNDRQADYIEKIQMSSKTLLGIINDILDFSKIEAGKLELESIKFNLDEVIDTIASMVSIRAAEKNIEFLYEIDNDVPNQLRGDPLRLGQVLTNLCSNAVKFTESGHIFISVNAQKSQDDTCLLSFMVQDTGVGMSQDRMDKLFEAFEQADSSITRKYGGSGLGLAISKKIVHMMGGEITVKSKLNYGSTFTFTVKVIALEASQKSRLQRIEALKNNRALIVDDNKLARSVMSQQLIDIGFETISVESGAEAIALLIEERDNPFGLVIMDWQMPEMDGVEATRQIIKHELIPYQPKIIMITAFGRDEIVYSAEEAGINAVLLKPVNKNLLRETVERVLLNVEVESSKKTANRNGILSNHTVQPSFHTQGIKVLIVEDVIMNQQIVSGILSLYGFETEIANNGLVATQMVKVNNYNLILMDVQMPVMSGYEATRHIRMNEKTQKLPIIAMTAHATKEVREKCLSTGMNDYLSKPVTSNELLSMIRKWIPSVNDESLVSTFDDRENEELIKKIMSIQLEGIDIESALKRVVGNAKLLIRMFTNFEEGFGDFASNLLSSIQNEEHENAKDIIHKMKGISGNVSANALFNMIVTFENEYDALSITERIEYVTDIERIIVELISSVAESRISELLVHKSSKKVSPTDIKQLFYKLKTEVENSDFEALETCYLLIDVLHGLINHQYTSELVATIEKYNFEKMMDLLLQMESELTEKNWGDYSDR